MKKNNTMPVFIQYLAGSITVIVIGVFLLNRSAKPKPEFSKVEGVILYLDQKFENLPTRHHGEFRYLIIEGTDRVFEIFIGNDPGDSSPEYEQIDMLSIGDTITLYYDDNLYTEDQLVNSLVRYIDRNEEPIFIENSKADKTFGYIAVAIGGVLALVLLVLKNKGRIN